VKKAFEIFKDKTVFAPEKCRRCRHLKICGTNARFRTDDCKSKWLLEPDCHLDEYEISITGGLNAEFARQDAKA
jgi:sulfatase maturation enzyme AslB (radical SAM superfamily)